jgi:predicted  nucleic acid-binding Zn-ribbon protein
MADTFKKVESESPANPAEDAWKDVQVEKEHQPEKEKSNLTYRGLEQQVVDFNNSIASLTERKAVLEAEMLQVKATAEAE